MTATTATVMAIVFAAAALAGLATWGLCTLADDPPDHCQGCRCDLPGHHYTGTVVMPEVHLPEGYEPPSAAVIAPQPQHRPTQLYDYEQDPAHQHPTAS
jgi:hypothetical protein